MASGTALDLYVWWMILGMSLGMLFLFDAGMYFLAASLSPLRYKRSENLNCCTGEASPTNGRVKFPAKSEEVIWMLNEMQQAARRNRIKLLSLLNRCL